MGEKKYIAIDLKSFYASVECVHRGLDPLDTNLVVADLSRTEKTICLAVSPSLKRYGIPGRARLFEVVQRVSEINAERQSRVPGHKLVGASHFAFFIDANPDVAVDYIVAPPRMASYMQMSAEIYQIYLKYVAPEDIHVYSVDEVFIDVTDYLRAYGMTAYELADTIVRDVLTHTGITATAGIGDNLYLSKIAMDIVAKHIEADRDGVRIAALTEQSYREQLWAHRPLTDFWRIGHGYARTLAAHGMFTMGDIARCSVYNEALLFRLFGKNAELLIDHAWGREPCEIRQIQSYRPESTSLSLGQVLKEPYDYDKARLIIREMTELLTLDLVDKGLVTDQLVLTVGYDIANLTDAVRRRKFQGEVVTDHYGRKISKQAHGSENLGRYTSSTRQLTEAVMRLFERIVDDKLLVRRMYVVANHTVSEQQISCTCEQLDLFSCTPAAAAQRQREEEERRNERKIQKTMLSLHKRFGKNAVIKGMNLKEGATTVERNGTIGGHRA